MSNMLGNRHLLALRFADALPHFSMALAQRPRDAGTVRKLLFCHALLGHPDDVRWLLPRLRGALPAVEPEGSILRIVAKEVRQHAPELGEARAHVALALTVVPGDPDAALRELSLIRPDEPEAEWADEIRRTIEQDTEVSDDPPQH